MRTRIPYRDAYALQHKAAANGAHFVTPFTSEWNLAQNCSSPVEREFWSRPSWRDGKTVSLERDKTAPINISIRARCRKCENCRRARGAQWADRVMREMIASDRAWFITLTIRPRRLQEAIDASVGKCITPNYYDLDNLEKFGRLHAELGPDVTKYLKVVRERMFEEYGAREKLSYALVAEPSPKRGIHIPHYHAVICSFSSERPLRKHHLHCGEERFYTPAWRSGFWNGKLVDRTPAEFQKTAWYVAKYLSKSLAARIRASQGFGTKTPDVLTNLAQA